MEHPLVANGTCQPEGRSTVRGHSSPDELTTPPFFTPDFSRLVSSEELLNTFDVERIEPAALMWQAGYLTLRDVREIGEGQWFCTLGYPNREAEAALNVSLLGGYGVPGDVSCDA